MHTNNDYNPKKTYDNKYNNDNNRDNHSTLAVILPITSKEH